MSIQEMREDLEAAGYFVGERDPKRNQAFTGQFMVCEDINEGPSESAGNGGFCIVGDNLDALIVSAHECRDWELLNKMKARGTHEPAR